MFNSKGVIQIRQAEGRQRVSGQSTTSAAHPHFSPAPLARGRGLGSRGWGASGEDFSSLIWALTPSVHWTREQVQVYLGPIQPTGTYSRARMLEGPEEASHALWQSPHRYTS